MVYLQSTNVKNDMNLIKNFTYRILHSFWYLKDYILPKRRFIFRYSIIIRSSARETSIWSSTLKLVMISGDLIINNNFEKKEEGECKIGEFNRQGWINIRMRQVILRLVIMKCRIKVGSSGQWTTRRRTWCKNFTIFSSRQPDKFTNAKVLFLHKM